MTLMTTFWGDFVFVIANILYFNILSLNYEGEVM